VGYDPNMRFWDAYVGGHGKPIRVHGRTEWDAKEELRRLQGCKRLPNGTVLGEVTGSLIQGSLL
jgi:hypothetical protein